MSYFGMAWSGTSKVGPLMNLKGGGCQVIEVKDLLGKFLVSCN